MEDHVALIDTLHALAQYAYRTGPEFQLSSSYVSHEYVDCRSALSRPDVLRNVGSAMWHSVRYPMLATPIRPAVAIGGMTLGADPLAISCSHHSAGSDHELSWFSVRKEPKGHGTKRRIEGSVLPGSSVVVVEDVVTTGASTIAAIQACREYGLTVVQVIALVDREECGGLERIEDEAQLKVNVLFTLYEIRTIWEICQ